MNAIGHEMILASAGSGKTFALTNRYIRLLAAGEPPERIVALTFTRKAAGEFFGAILERLAGAAEDATEAAKLARSIGWPAGGPDDFRRMLRRMVTSMHRLNLGTLDGFFARIVRAFPLELGLAGEPAVLDDHTATEELRRAMGRLFAAPGGLTLEQRSVIEAYKLATFGQEAKAVGGRFESFVAEYLELYRQAPDAGRWGAVARIWPQGFPWGEDHGDARAAGEVIRAWAASREAGLKDAVRERWCVFSEQAEAFVPGGGRPAELNYLLKIAVAAWERLGAGTAEVAVLRQRSRLPAEVCAAVVALVRRIMALELGRRLATTQGIAKLLEAFDRVYDAEVRRAGRLTFADLQQLLAPELGAPALGMAAGGGSRRLQLDYRIDARFDHWLFDEFQDTSYAQWSILENLIDEVVLDPERRRSLFYVGDVKQAIFTWRGGDPRLFRQVARRYESAPGGGVHARELNESYRSGPAVIEMVNRVCGDAPAIARLFPEAADEWNGLWRSHVSARPALEGQAALLWAADEAGRWATTLRLIQAIDPIGRRLSCAVLVPKNETGARLADYLRREGGVPAVAESDLHVAADNPAAGDLIALLQAAAHPIDTMAWRQVALSPVGRLLEEEGRGNRAAAVPAVLAAVRAEGFGGWVAAWARRLEPVLAADDRFSRLRLAQLAAAAREFDAGGTADIDAFLRFLADYTIREPEAADIVRVMTVHKSKGLGFDVVILPELEGQRLAQRRDGPAVQKNEARGVEWVLHAPDALVAGHDPVLRRNFAQAVAENCYEQMSLFYVALTRAKRALYAVVEPPGSSESVNVPRWLAATLGEGESRIDVGDVSLVGAWSSGDGAWPRGVPRHGGAVLANDIMPTVPTTGRAALAPRMPSETTMRAFSATELFRSDAAQAAELGEAVHALLAQVEWCGPADAGGWRDRWLREGRDAGATELAVACLADPRLRPVFGLPDGNGAVWREQPFEAVIRGEWVSGVIDRVVVEYEADGRPRRASLFDFKTDRESAPESLRRRHARQIEIYREVVAALVGVPAAQVGAWLVAVRERRLVEAAG